jgi:hypothetical protein
MKSTTVRKYVIRAASLAAALLVAGGCAHKTAEPKKVALQSTQVTDIQIVDSIRNSGVKAAIVSQHTLYPYHFVRDGESLNELGQRDLAVLASHLRAHGGDLCIPRGGTETALYDGRVRHVMDWLIAQGVSADHVHVVDAVGGAGEASPSEDVVRDLRSMRSGPMQSNSSATSTQIQPTGTVNGGQQ